MREGATMACEKVNGWSNYETWVARSNGFADLALYEVRAYARTAEGGYYQKCDAVANELKQRYLRFLGQGYKFDSNDIIFDNVIRRFGERIRWHELVDVIYGDIIEEVLWTR